MLNEVIYFGYKQMQSTIIINSIDSEKFVTRSVPVPVPVTVSLPLRVHIYYFSHTKFQSIK